MSAHQHTTPVAADRSVCSPAEKLLFSTAEACAILSIGRTSLYKLLADGTLRSRRMRGKRLVEGHSIRAFSRECQGGMPPETLA